MSAENESGIEPGPEHERFQGRYEFFRVKSWRKTICQFLMRLSESWPQAILRTDGHGDELVRECGQELPSRMPDVGHLLLARDQEMLSALATTAQVDTSTLTDVIALDFRAEGKDVAKLILHTPKWAENDTFSARASRLLSEASGCEAYPDYGGMVPGGWDYLASGFEDASRAAAAFLDEIVQRWPGALIEMEEATSGACRLIAVPEWPLSFAGSVALYIARDSAMQEYWQETGGTPMPDGEGPLSLYVNKHSDGTWSMTLVTPAPAHDDEFSAWAVQALSDACQTPVTLADDIDKDWPHPCSSAEAARSAQVASERASET